MASALSSQYLRFLPRRLPQNATFSRRFTSSPAPKTLTWSQATQSTSALMSRPSRQQHRSFVIPRPNKPSQPQQSSSQTPPATVSSADAKTSAGAAPERSERLRVETQPHYSLHFTCVPCGHRSAHKISKQGYHHGSVLITCSECKNRHVISDHLGIFGDRKVTVEDLMRERGHSFKKGVLGENGDIEYWHDDAVPGEFTPAADGQK
ncbi:hypothetical protein PpBr36_03749 [Pyricularia pennisetigena]|uniref:hypothetical protein n=1 Tax=Pyricularia pennisetigena TaxID=1578925 RepID=UPI001152516B|nr:hypothetical protein PpBr36_03749 [Pyricularia pennisetigena]TLS31084.1 hypothetical protein PpBr36_03749 [Pyricularia pennisetigena]